MTVDPDAPGDADSLALLAPGARRASRTVRLRLGIGAAVVLVVGALVVTVVISLLAPGNGNESVPAVKAQTGQGASIGGPAGDPTGTAKPGVVYVHVLGAVNRPGLYQLSTGARVVDAVAAAGGFTADANQGGVNLARPLSDGEQLVVPKAGEPVPGDAFDRSAPGAAAGGGNAAGSGVGGSVAGGKVNLNTAGDAELQTLPHVGPALASRILQWRKDNGRFATVDDLTAVSGIGAKTFESLKDLVTV